MVVPGESRPALAEGDELVAHAPAKGPYRRIAMHFTALPNAITFTQQPDVQRNASVSIDVYVHTEDGTLLLTSGRELQLRLAPKARQRIMDSVLGMKLTVSVHAGRPTFRRMGIEDTPSGHFGVIEDPRIARISASRKRAEGAVHSSQF